VKLYVFHCRDGESSAPLRDAALAAHLDHVAARIDHYAVAGDWVGGAAWQRKV
jgi:hypothetical protein